MMDALGGYLNNIAATATQMADPGVPLAELAASLTVSVDTIARQQQKIKRLTAQLHAFTKKGPQETKDKEQEKLICKKIEAVGRTTPHGKKCFFDPKNMNDRKEWARELMENNGVPCKDDKLRWGTAKTVVRINPSKDNIMYESSLSCILTQKGNILQQHRTGIVDSGATHIYIAPSAPHGHTDTKATPITVGTANGQMVISTAIDTLPIPQSAADFPTIGCIVPSFTDTLIGVRPICDADCKVLFMKKDVVVISPEGKTILTGWREKNLPKLWRFVLKPNGQEIIDTTTNLITPAAHNA